MVFVRAANPIPGVAQWSEGLNHRLDLVCFALAEDALS
ncbi:hypothetical protein CBM2633_B40103 [Cupriavidus taiwanensis]|nr:hypothetical protein CBM2633_B40103 [Cupriavidus taiwanensis]